MFVKGTRALLDIMRSSKENNVPKNLIRKEVQKEMKRVAAGGTEPVKKRVKEPIESVTEPVIERKMNRKMGTIIREIREIKEETREIKEGIKHLIEALSRQGAPADGNINPGRSKARKYRLLFVNKLHSIIFTKEKIKDKNDGYVEINLVDTIAGKIVEAGPLSSIKIEIVVLNGNFEENGNWTGMDFNANVVIPRDNKRLVNGKQKITLRGGVGTIEDFCFTDISSWTDGKKFRLGARVVESNIMGQVIFKEAVSEAFVVRDYRQKNKHLVKIIGVGKFSQALKHHKILTGSVLKQMYEKNPDKLREILNGVTDKEWEVIVQYGPCYLDNANSNPARSRDATTYPQLHQGMHNDSSRASSSQHISACPPECLQDLTPPLAMSTSPTHVNSQSEPSNDNHQPQNNCGSVWNSATFIHSINDHLSPLINIQNTLTPSLPWQQHSHWME